MTRKFKHKGLEAFSKSGTLAGIQPAHAKRLAAMLSVLRGARQPSDMDQPGFKFHRLQGAPVRWSVWVSGNWRLTFEFQHGEARNIDYEDYH